MDSLRQTFKKQERLCSRKVIEALFAGGNKSWAAFPLRVVAMETKNSGECGVRVLISVSKRRFHHAVDRNRVKRLVREAYRKNKGILTTSVGNRSLAIAFLWLSPNIPSAAVVESKVVQLLRNVAEDIA